MLDPAPASTSPRRLCVRPIAPRDRAALAAGFARLSPVSRARRFHGPKPTLTERELHYLTEVDHVAHEAIVAETPGGDLVGVARYATWPGSAGAADLAVTVADEMQGQGLGTSLSREIVARARANGIHRLVATTSWENAAARALVRRLGFRGRGSAGATVDLELPLGASPAVPAPEAAGWPGRRPSLPPAPIPA